MIKTEAMELLSTVELSDEQWERYKLHHGRQQRQIVFVDEEPTEMRLTTDPLPQSETAFRRAILTAVCFCFLVVVAVTELMK